MVHACPECRIMLSFQRKETLNPDLIAGHWYGCPGCARNVCDACGRASGRHCRECGATLEPDQCFPVILRPLEDWRPYIPGEDDVLGDGLRHATELIACATEASIRDIDTALPEWARDSFREMVLSLDIERRLGSTDYLFVIGEREMRWTPAWEQRLSVAASYYAETGGDPVHQALQQRELLRGWDVLAPASRPAMGAVLEAVVHPGQDVAKQALKTLESLQPSLGDVRGSLVPMLQSGEPARVQRGLAVLRCVLDQQDILYRAPRDAVEQRLCEALARCGAADIEALLTRIAAPSDPRRADPAATAIGALGLVEEVFPLLSRTFTQSRRHRQNQVLSFIAAMGRPAGTTSVRTWLLERLEQAESLDTAKPLLSALGRIGAMTDEALHRLEAWVDEATGPRRVEALRLLIDLLSLRGLATSEELRARCLRAAREAGTPEERLALIRLLCHLPPAQRQALFPEHPEPGELLVMLLEETGHTLGSQLDADWLTPLLATPRLRDWLMALAREEPDCYLTSVVLDAAGPECGGLLLPLQRKLADRSEIPYRRASWLRTLGRITPGPGSPAHALLLAALLDQAESVDTRITAARTLWTLGVRALPGTRLLPALRDRSAAIRSWALLLVDELDENLAGSLREDPSPLVRWTMGLRT
ncbi:hypothetical protein NR798_31905 [Archangium gephyra]|uniref:hypothetical protein n=1 Tax=Archangium gephyra TaxID=48 RepID=UPI0035D50725